MQLKSFDVAYVGTITDRTLYYRFIYLYECIFMHIYLHIMAWDVKLYRDRANFTYKKIPDSYEETKKKNANAKS